MIVFLRDSKNLTKEEINKYNELLVKFHNGDLSVAKELDALSKKHKYGI